MISISPRANEQSTIMFRIDFADENGSPAAPKTMVWSLADAAGNPVNGREKVPIAIPEASVTVVLSGDDLRIQPAEAARSTVERRLIVEATYDSDLGTDLPVKEQVMFEIQNLTLVS